MVTSAKLLKDVFFCPEESNFYSHCLETLVLSHCSSSEVIIEFGSGDGSPVINSLIKSEFEGTIYGYELNKLSWRLAQSSVKEHQLDQKYVISNGSFFELPKPEAKYLISNPPYLPALDSNILQPLLHGGIDGSEISRKLLSLNYQNVLLLVASYSNPKGLINYAKSQGYSVANFIVYPLPFGYYSSESKVKNTIQELKQKDMAFYSENMYLLAGVLFTKQHQPTGDLSQEVIQLMTCL